MSPEAFGSLLFIVLGVMGIVVIALFVISLIWVYRDAEARGKSGCLWLLIAFFTWPFGVIAYRILRDKPVQL